MTWTEAFKLSEAVTSIATVVLVFLVWQQIRLARKQATTTFEDSLTEQYRGIMENIPTDIWLGSELKALNEERRDRCRDAIYRYIDLSNEQAFLHQCGRVRSCTWQFWHDGIASNLKRPAFKHAWSDVCLRCSDFSELRALFPPDTKQKIADSRAVYPDHCANRRPMPHQPCPLPRQ